MRVVVKAGEKQLGKAVRYVRGWRRGGGSVRDDAGREGESSRNNALRALSGESRWDAEPTEGQGLDSVASAVAWVASSCHEPLTENELQRRSRFCRGLQG